MTVFFLVISYIVFPNGIMFYLRVAKDYVMHVLFKEVINYLAMEHLGLPYQLADERGRSTEVSKIEELKKVITDNSLYN